MGKAKKPTFYITTPIYYVNGAPHIGSCYTTLACDIMARFKKLDGYDVKFLTGTDEHGQKIEQSAKEVGKSPQKFVDEISETFVDLIKLMNFEPSVFDSLGRYKNNNFSFIRTTHSAHGKVAQDIWIRLVKNGWIYRDKYSGWYCISDEAYYTESDLVKDKNGEWKTNLGKSVEWREEDSYFFRLKEFKKILLVLYKFYPDFIQPETKRNEIISFVDVLDRDLSISRNNFDWGIRIPVDLSNKELLDEKGEWKSDVELIDRHVIYVWLDALFNYISALGGLKGEDYKKYWKNNPDKIHIMGKEIIRFHAVYWPAFLIACEYSKNEIDKKHYDENFVKEILDKGILPSVVFAHGFWECEGRKMSKSFGNIIVPATEIEWLQKDFGISKEIAVDYLRYFLITEMPFGNDGNYLRQRLVDRVNAELVNNIGNLAQRTLSMIYKNYGGIIPSPTKDNNNANDGREFFCESQYSQSINAFKYDIYVQNILKLASEANQYIEEQKPWELKKTNPAKLQTVLYTLAEIIRKIAILLQPFCPHLAKKMLQQLKIDEQYNIDLEKEKVFFAYLQNKKYNLKSGVKMEEPQGIFPRLKNN
jgi:methionyl-tRNA synthetase